MHKSPRTCGRVRGDFFTGTEAVQVVEADGERSKGGQGAVVKRSDLFRALSRVFSPSAAHAERQACEMGVPPCQPDGYETFSSRISGKSRT